MFSTIFKQELKYWFNKPAFYIYSCIFLLLSFFLAASSAGIFDFITATTGSSRIVNSPKGVSSLFNGLSTFIYFLFPSIIGVSVYRDYKSEMHTILYSYPFTKANYLFAKFFSAILVVSIIVFVIALGMIVGFRFPGTNQDIVGVFNVVTYLKAYLVFILPNVLLFGAIVFAVVTFTRNITAGFITVIILMFGQVVLKSVLSDPKYRALIAILDPFGESASSYYTKYWTPAEQNELQIPIKEFIIYNRLLWLAISSVIFGLVYQFFSFSQNALTFSFRKQKGKRSIKSNFSGITKITLPKVHVNYSFSENLKSMWKLSQIDFKYIVKSWPFIAIVIVGLLLMLVGLSEIGDVFGTATLPVTWKMLSNGNIFAVSINICTFLYAGMLVHRTKIYRINHLVDATAIPNWTLLFSKVIALLKMQLVLLAVIMVSGMVFQIYNGYYNFEIGHYFMELFVLDFLSFLIWAFLSICIQTLVGNPYLGLFILLVISIGVPFLSLAGIEQSIFKYNEGPGYNYSDMNGYGLLSPYISYKIYWVLCGLMLLIISALFWVRGIPNSFSERITLAKKRFEPVYIVSFSVFLLLFLSLGTSIYLETGTKSKHTSSKEAELQSVNWEKKYKKYEGVSQPRIIGVKADVAIFPKKRTYTASGTFTMVNKTKTAIDTIFLNYNSLQSTFKFNKPNRLVSEDTLYHFNMYKFDKKIMPGDTLQLLVTVKSKENTMYRVRSPILENGT
ncbi:MAG: ABC transporter permease, partial [Polaribacter sp.]